MTTCPVCEHTQAQGDACDECGQVLVHRAVNVTAVPMPDLEVTSHDNEPDWGVSQIAELELTAVATPDRSTQATMGATVTCRYCQTPQTEGMFCGRCGMRLSRRAGVVPGAESSASHASAAAKKPRSQRDDDAAKTRCRACGAPARGGQPCTDCGHPVPMPEL